MFRITAAALACAAFTSVASAEELTFTFDDPTGGNEFQGNAGMPGSLSYDTGAVLDFVVDTSEFVGGGVTTFSAMLEMDLEVGTPSNNGGVITAPVNGSFTFTDLGSGEVLFTAQTNNAQLVNFGVAGSLISSVDGTGTGLTFDAGPAMLLVDIIEMMALDAVFTLTNIDVEGASQIFSGIGGQNPELNNFSANAAFTATAEGTLIPTPGAAALAGLGVIGFGFRRRRA